MTLAYVGELQDNLEKDLYLGPATVTGVRGLRPLVTLPSGEEVVAEMALAFPYNPTRGDNLLVIGKDGKHYAIGVLTGKGETSLRFQGDVNLEAVGGKLRLVSDEKVLVRSPIMEVQVEKVRTFAETIVNKATNIFQNVREMVSTRAGEKHDLIAGDVHTHADRATITTKGVTTINGKEVHLN